MKKYKLKEVECYSIAPFRVYKRCFLFFWKHIKSYTSKNKALSAVKMFELNDKKK